MEETTVESLFGIKAGIVWKALNQNGATNLANLVKSTSLSREEIYGALGWLGREGKLVIRQKGRAMVYSLQEEEAHLAVLTDTTIGDTTPKAKSKRRKSKPLKKVKEAREIKNPAKQADKKMEEFLLH